VSDDFFRAPSVAVRVAVERVREIAAQHRTHREIHELANTVGSPENADVRVHAHYDQIPNPAICEQVKDLLAVVAHRILSIDDDLRGLARPGEWGIGVTARLRGVTGARSRVGERRG